MLNVRLRSFSHCKLFNLTLLLCCLALLNSCSKANPVETKRTILKFGTLIEVTLYDVEPLLAEQALNQLEKDFTRYHASWTPWQAGPLQRTNKLLTTGSSFSVPPSILPLIKQSRILSEQSEGLFNPSIGKLIRLWQFHKHDEADITPPEKASIEELVKQNPSMQDLQINGIKLQSNNPSTELNFGAFAKGYAIDLSMDYLHSLSINNAVINAGGDLSVSGSHGSRAWEIGIRHPRSNGVIGWLQAKNNESIFTSGDYERFYIYKGKRYHHILDPRTGYPAEGTSSVTVIHNNAGIADAAATALFIAGPEHWHNIAKRMNIHYVLLIDTKGNLHMNPEMAKRLHLKENHGFHIVLSEPL